MNLERTLSIIKPDAVKRNLIGAIYHRIEKAGLCIIAAKMLRLNEKQVLGFYTEHQDKFYYPQLKEFMISGPIMVQILEGRNAVACYRELIGKMNPEEAACGTIRSDYALSTRCNSVHGSDNLESAVREIEFFFPVSEIYPH
ncbi:nucleoside diphosphate kinase [Candidatus Photodesmus blepharus]|uniref:Nucleoside diphosphate kinase n=1 Tax=Candidatus Photodesmus blepharonis TaxID=1179155 RepID=A0A084CPG1_9GAMM|nr:nucleoside-diphosphate kinase [Candidatus Photodesmus blepharus]KEY91690.1 nucleoside diphosphate kinase [Candidatus Photodesmus blepharus]